MADVSKPKPNFHILSPYAKFDVPNWSTWVQNIIFGRVKHDIFTKLAKFSYKKCS